MPVKGKSTLTVDEKTHYEITMAAHESRCKIYVFVNEVWDFWKRKGKALPAPVIHFEGPRPEEGYQWVKVPDRLAPKFQRLVELFSDDPKRLRSMLELLESSKNQSR